MNARYKAYLIVLASFTLGIGVGFLTARLLIHSTLEEFFGRKPGFHSAGAFPPPGDPGMLLERHLENIAQPTEEQEKKLRPILQKYQERLHGMMENHLHRMESILDSMDAEVGTVLDSAQMKRLHAHRRRHLGPMGDPPMWDGERGPPPKESEEW